MRINLTTEDESYAATRLRYAIELGDTDRDLNLLLHQLLCDIGIGVTRQGAVPVRKKPRTEYIAELMNGWPLRVDDIDHVRNHGHVWIHGDQAAELARHLVQGGV